MLVKVPCSSIPEREMLALLVAIAVAVPVAEAAQVGLGQLCESDKDCKIAYSNCAGVCKCRPSFQLRNGLCVSANFCPHAKNKKPHQSIGTEYCVIEGYDTTLRQNIGNCSSGSFCFEHPNTYSPSGQRMGVCCPQADSTFNMVCPQGEVAIKNAKCRDKVTALADQVPARGSDTCTSDTTQCVDWRNKYVCCTKPCPDPLINIGGRCYDYAPLGEPCDHDYQCPDNAKCTSTRRKIGKTCQCPYRISNGYCLKDYDD